ncbi:MAG: hypothetical protein ACTHN0_05760 [Aquihabitans sp.]
MKLESHGIETDLPAGWEGRIGVRTQPSADTRAIGDTSEVPHPIVHLANFALPEQRGDFGSGAVDLMGADDVLVVLFEYGPECANTALFKRKGIPSNLTPSMFSSSALQRTLPGQAGCQIFFTENGRAFCSYTVLGRQSSALRVLPQANAALSRTRIAPR